MINALLNNPMARQALHCIDLTSKHLGRYSGFAQKSNCSLELRVKSFIDYMGAIFLILLFSPVLLIVAVLVKLSSPWPVIYSQEGAGLNRPRPSPVRWSSICPAGGGSR
jgi:lipopolysaccharide/colanic/teichoic acid biosynthesis glycosyltransferase